MSRVIKIVSDKYRKARGGWTRFLQISCGSCGHFLFFYQKDGPGPLKRSYLDRIIGEKPLFDKKGFYFCKKCKTCLGFYEPYKKENGRPAIRWANQAVNSKLIHHNQITIK